MKDLPRKIEIDTTTPSWPVSTIIITLVQALMHKAITNNRKDYSVFVSYYGHTNEVNLDIYYNGWRSKVDRTAERKTATTIYLDKDGAFEKLQAAIDSIEVQS